MTLISGGAGLRRRGRSRFELIDRVTGGVVDRRDAESVLVSAAPVQLAEDEKPLEEDLVVVGGVHAPIVDGPADAD